jgi:hypothetical protein
VADARLRGRRVRPAFFATLKARGIEPGGWKARQLERAIGELRRAPRLPGRDDDAVDFWGAESCWARRFGSNLWLYYSFDEEDVHLWGVHDHLHVQ